MAVGQLRGSFLNFNGHGFERVVAEVLFGMPDGRPPRDVTPFVSYGLDLGCRVGGSEVLIGEKDRYAIRQMRVYGAFPDGSILTLRTRTWGFRIPACGGWDLL